MIQLLVIVSASFGQIFISKLLSVQSSKNVAEIKYKMNSRLLGSRILNIAVFAAFTLSWLFVSIVMPMKANALNGANFIFDPGDPASTTAQRTANDNFNSDGNDYNESGWSQFKVYAKDFSGLGPKLLSYNKNDSIIYNSGRGGAEGQRQPVFTLTYFCAANDGKITDKRPSDGVFYEIKYAVVLEDSNGKEAAAFMNRDTYNAYGGILTVKKTDASDSDKITRNLVKGEYHANGPKLGASAVADSSIYGDDNFGISDAKCRPKAEIIGKTGVMRNYNKLSDADKEVLAAAKAAGDDEGDDGGDPCTGGTTISLSWIICPVINLGYEATDYVFENLIQPLLEDVPVSTATDDNTYIAWKSFRTLGNIVLVGTLIAVVYAQARGDR